jgi:hypothetical protein
MTRENADDVKEVLYLYCRASGQQINFDKSSIHFSKGCRHNVKDDIKVILDVQKESPNEKYLGMSSDCW